ncbi:MAG TPA: aspartate aminotransferase family protein, partial [Terracidiphilus sp.]|nr:aspartate aminotransferase family protein [Terracidiphilus sp.]
ARGFSTYAALRELGRAGVASLVERCCDLAYALVTGIGALPGARVVREPRINQGLVQFTNMPTDEVIAKINASGEAYFGGTTWRGERSMRVSVCNWMTSAADVERVIAAVRKIIA